MKELSLHLLDLAENSVSAQAHTITIAVCEDLVADRLQISVADDGKGMAPEVAARVVDPFYTSRTTRNVGLGIPLLKEAAETCGGRLELVSQPGMGTTITAIFTHSHIDRMPLGNLPDTLLGLLVAHPEIHWVFHYYLQLTGSAEPYQFAFDDQPVKEILDGLPLSEPSVLAFLRETLTSGIIVAEQRNLAGLLSEIHQEGTEYTGCILS